MQKIELEIPDHVASVSTLSRRADIPVIPRFEVHLSHTPLRDSRGRGAGDIWGHGYSTSSLEQALEFALENLEEAKAKRLVDMEARLEFHIAKLAETPMKPIDPRFSNIELEL